MKRAVYPGSFDPFTLGHLDVIQRGLKIFDGIVVAVSSESHKQPSFSVEERVWMVKTAVKGLDRVEVESFSGLTVDFVRRKGINVILRGIRTVSDFEYEFQMALTNRAMADDIETIFVTASEKYSFLSSTLIKQTASLGGDISSFVPASICDFIVRRLGGGK